MVYLAQSTRHPSTGRKARQLPLTSIVEIYKAGKVRTVMMLRESRDQKISDRPVEGGGCN